MVESKINEEDLIGGRTGKGIVRIEELPKKRTETISALLSMNGICKKSKGLLEKL